VRHQRSPLTNEPIGTKLLPAPHVRNMIRAAVKSGSLSGEKAKAWQKKIAEEDMNAQREGSTRAPHSRYLVGVHLNLPAAVYTPRLDLPL